MDAKDSPPQRVLKEGKVAGGIVMLPQDHRNPVVFFFNAMLETAGRPFG